MQQPTIVGTPTTAIGAGVGDVVLAKPSAGVTVQNGDVLIAALRGQNASGAGDYALAGWSRIGPAFIPNNDARLTGFFIHVVTNAGTEPATYTFVPTTRSGRSVGAMFVVRGVDTTNPVVATSASLQGEAIGAGRRATGYSFTAVEHSLALLLGANETTSPNPDGPSSASSSYTQLVKVASGTDTGTTRTIVYVGQQTLATGASSVPDADVLWANNAGSVAQTAVLRGAADPVVPTFPVKVKRSGSLVTGNLKVKRAGSLVLPTRVRTVRAGVHTVTDLLAKPAFVVAHRLGSRNWPEHSMHGATQSLMRGVDALEFSIGKSSDGVFFGLHDDTINRTSGTTGLPVAQQMTWAEISSYQVLASLTDDPTQPNRPYLKFDDLRDAYPNVVLFLDPKYLGQTGAIAFFQNLKDTIPGATEKFVLKYSFTATNLAIPIGAMGFKSWGYLYENDLASANFNTSAAPWTILGMDYNTSDAGWADFKTRMDGMGKKYTGHIAPTLAAAQRALSYGAIGNMVSGVKQVKGF